MDESSEQRGDARVGGESNKPDDGLEPAALARQVQEEVSAAAKVAEDYRSKMFEYMKVNVNAALDYANSLAGIKSPADLIGLAGGPRKPPSGAGGVSDPDISAATKAAEEYRGRVFDFMKSNMNATLEYALRLASVKTPSEFIELSTTHARKQFEQVTAQTRELGELAQKLATCNTERLAERFSKVFPGMPKR